MQQEFEHIEIIKQYNNQVVHINSGRDWLRRVYKDSIYFSYQIFQPKNMCLYQQCSLVEKPSLVVSFQQDTQNKLDAMAFDIANHFQSPENRLINRFYNAFRENEIVNLQGMFEGFAKPGCFLYNLLAGDEKYNVDHIKQLIIDIPPEKWSKLTDHEIRGTLSGIKKADNRKTYKPQSGEKSVIPLVNIIVDAVSMTIPGATADFRYLKSETPTERQGWHTDHHESTVLSEQKILKCINRGMSIIIALDDTTYIWGFDHTFENSIPIRIHIPKGYMIVFSSDYWHAGTEYLVEENAGTNVRIFLSIHVPGCQFNGFSQHFGDKSPLILERIKSYFKNEK